MSCLIHQKVKIWGVVTNPSLMDNMILSYSATSSCQLWQLLHAVASFDCWRLLWQLLQAVATFDSCYKLLPALRAGVSCRQLWQLSQVVASCYKLSSALTALTSCCQLWKLLQAVVTFHSCCQLSQLLSAFTAVKTVASFHSCYKLLPYLTAITSCCHLWQPALTAFYTPLVAKPQLQFKLNIASMFDSKSKGQIIQIPC